MRTFRSDNNAGLCPEALDALVRANDASHAIGYGDDGWTRKAEAAFQSLFGADVRVAFVATGTAANTLAIASMLEPWHQVLCHSESHWANHESTAPERITGCRTRRLAGCEGKLRPQDLAEAALGLPGDVHEPQPGVLTISNTTELGLVYTPEETRALCEAAHAAGYLLHVDGARYANAVAALACDPRALAGDAGVDALSFGGTKNGLAFGEAVLFFPQGDGRACERAAARFPFQRKSTGHLVSKHRFLSAPFAAVLESGAWLTHAAHANAMARRLGDGLAAIGIPPVVPVESNGVFVRFPATTDRVLIEAGYGYYGFGDPRDGTSRLLCSFDTQPEDVDHFLQTAHNAQLSARTK